MKKPTRCLAKLEFPKAPAALPADDLRKVRGGDGLIIPCYRTIIPCIRIIIPCVRMP